MATSAGATSAAPSSVGSVSFKAYLVQKGSEKPKEVRRFGVEQNEVTSFLLLKKKIRQVFPSLATQEFSISWKDFEEDDIIISSNEELLTALTETTDQVRRLYLSPKNPISVSIQPSFEFRPMSDLVAEVNIPVGHPSASANDSDDDEDEGILLTPPGCKRSWRSALRGAAPKMHPNVYCDGCNKSISNHRYKCLECDDFDLCLECESKMMHKEHIMLRIPLVQCHYTMLNNFTKAMHHMSDALHKIDSRCKKQERRMHKIYEGNMKRCDDFMGLADDMIHLSKRCRRDLKDKKDKKEKKEWTTSASCSSATAGASATSSSGSQQPSANRAAQGACPFPAGIINSILNSQTLGNLLNPQNLSSFQQLIEQMSPVPEELLQEVAQNLADVRLNDPETPSSTPNPSASAPSGNPFSVNMNKSTSATESDGAIPSTSTAAQASAAQASAAQASAAQASAPSQREVPASENQAASAILSGSQAAATIQFGVADVPSQSGRSSRSSSEETDTEGWMVVDSQMNNNADQSQVYPKLPVVEPTPEPVVPQPAVSQPAVSQPAPLQTQIPFHRDPEVQKCLGALAEMGYDVNQRTIIELAEEYKGNLSRVLNILLS